MMASVRNKRAGGYFRQAHMRACDMRCRRVCIAQDSKDDVLAAFKTMGDKTGVWPETPNRTPAAVATR